MYILKNAWKSIIRNKARNILICVIALVIALSACVALSIRQAAETAKENTLSGMSVTAQISYDRSAAMSSQMKENSGQAGSGSFDKKNFDFSKMSGSSLTLDEYMEYTQDLSDDDSYYYTMTVSLNGTDDFSAYSTTTEEATEAATEASTAASSSDSRGSNVPGGEMGGAMHGGMMGSTGDFSVTGYSSYDAMMNLFGTDGTCTISDGSMFDENTEDMVCVISDELAMYNNLSVGDKITMENTNYEKETYTFTVCGIYTNSNSDQGNSMFSMSDPANNIYTSYNALNSVVAQSKTADNKYTNDNDEETSAVISGETQFTYVFPSVDNYNSFSDKVNAKGLPENYTLSSTDLTSFENSMTPLNTLSSMAGWFFLIVLAIGGVILVVINIFNLRERKYEVGVLTAIGMKKWKVATQFICELLCITFIAIIIGAAAGAVVSVPVTNSLLENQISSSQSSSDNVANNFGFDNGSSNKGGHDFGSGAGGNVPSAGGKMGSVAGGANTPQNYISSVASATDFTVILEMILVGLFLTIISGLAAMITIMRYEPLKILSSRS